MRSAASERYWIGGSYPVGFIQKIRLQAPGLIRQSQICPDLDLWTISVSGGQSKWNHRQNEGIEEGFHLQLSLLKKVL